MGGDCSTEIAKYVIIIVFLFLVISFGYTIWGKIVDNAFEYLKNILGEEVAGKIYLVMFLILFVALIVALIF